MSSLLLVSSTHLYILRKLPEHKSMAYLVSSRPLEAITRITSRKNVPEVITFRYGSPDDDEQDTTGKTKDKCKTSFAYDKLYLPDAGDATKNIKMLIVKALNMFDDVSQPKPS